ncbi:MAG: hypothetical protein V1646_01590 [bacterium]
MQKIRKALIVLALLGLTLSADAMKRTIEEAGAVEGNPFDRRVVQQLTENSEFYEAQEFSLNMPVGQLKEKLTQEILVNWPLNTPEKVINVINYLLQWRFALTNQMMIEILLAAWVQVDSIEEWNVVINRDVIQQGNRDCADILIDLYLACGKVVFLSLLEFNQTK